MAAKHLDALERRLGVTLVHRSTRRLSLTEAGQQLLPEVERLLAGLAEAESSASDSAVKINGLLRVSVPVSFGILHVAPLVPAFTRRNPHVIIELGLNDRYVDLMEENWDVALRIGRLADSALIARKLAPIKAVICGSPTYLKKRGVPRTLADLSKHDCLGYTLAPSVGTKTWSFGQDGKVQVPVRGSLHSNNGEALVAAAIAGQGLVYGPEFIVAHALATKRLIKVALDEPPIDLGGVHAVTHPDRRPTAKSRAWIEYLYGALARLRVHESAAL
jgi:DNA-binding transcriptional LysR family regulator